MYSTGFGGSAFKRGRSTVVRSVVWARRTHAHNRGKGSGGRERGREWERETSRRVCSSCRWAECEWSEAGELATPQPGPPLLPDRPSVAQHSGSGFVTSTCFSPPPAHRTACGIPCFYRSFRSLAEDVKTFYLMRTLFRLFFPCQLVTYGPRSLCNTHSIKWITHWSHNFKNTIGLEIVIFNCKTKLSSKLRIPMNASFAFSKKHFL